MALYSNDDFQYDIAELLNKYRSLRAGKTNPFLEEEAYEVLINYYLDRNQLHKAKEAADIGLEHFPFSALILLKKADLLIDLQMYDDALDLVQKAEIYDSQNIAIYILKADIYIATDQPELAAATIETALSKFDGDEKVELLFELVDVYDDYEKYEYIFDTLAQILTLEPQDEEALNKICFWAEKTNRNEDSIILHQKIIDQHPYTELAWFNLGSAYQSLKLYEKCIDAYDYAIVINDKFDYAHRNAADAYIKLRNYKKAIEYLNRVVELSPPEDIIYEAIGYCYEKLKNYTDARFFYKKAVHISPQLSHLHNKVAETYMMQQQWKQAIAALSTAHKIAPKHPEFHYNLATCYFQLDDFTLAIEHAVATIDKRPKFTKAWELIFTCLYYLDEFSTGYNMVKSAIEQIGAKPIFDYYKVLFLYGLRKIKDAAIYLEQGLIHAPKQLNVIIAIESGILQHRTLLAVIMRYKKILPN